MCLFMYSAVALCSTWWKTIYWEAFAKKLRKQIHFTETCNCSTVTTSDRFISEYFPPIFPLLPARIFLPISTWDVSTTNRLKTYLLFSQTVIHLQSLISRLLASSWKTGWVTRAQTRSTFFRRDAWEIQWCFSRLIRTAGFGKGYFPLRKSPPIRNGLVFHMFYRGSLRDTYEIIWRLSWV